MTINQTLQPMKDRYKLNNALAELAKVYINKDDMIEICRLCDIGVPKLKQVLNQTAYAEANILDMIQRMILVKHKNCENIIDHESLT